MREKARLASVSSLDADAQQTPLAAGPSLEAIMPLEENMKGKGKNALRTDLACFPRPSTTWWKGRPSTKGQGKRGGENVVAHGPPAWQDLPMRRSVPRRPDAPRVPTPLASAPTSLDVGASRRLFAALAAQIVRA